MPLLPAPSSDDYARGSLDARLVIVHYGDFECPYSGALAPLLAQTQATMSDQVCLIFRNFPLADLHPHAMRAALAAESAGDKFWEMHDLLFANQKALEDDDLEGYAAQIGLDSQRFLLTLNAPETRAKVEQSIEGGRKNGVHGTPSVFINGTFYDNDRQLWKSSKLGRILEAAL